jgi:hypothetical protein
MREPGILVARLPSSPTWEPMIVTTLRRFVRRGAPISLLQRIAGSARDWRDLNGRWNLDGRRVVGRKAAPVLDEGGMAALSTAERRIALLQMADECAEAGVPVPAIKALAVHFGVSRHTIACDFRLLGESGKLAWRLESDGESGVRRFPVAP